MGVNNTNPRGQSIQVEFTLYVIRYDDGSLESSFGTFEDAQRKAEEKKGCRGGYTIL